MIRIGAVGFLNARPLVLGLAREPWCTVRTDVPSVCARLLHDGDIDLGLVPSIELLRGPQPYELVPGAAIACRGAVGSVALFTSKPVQAIRTIALDTSSRASAALLQVLCARHYGITPRFVNAPPDLQRMVREADAGLLIGDPALEAPWERLGLAKVDLGQAWWDMTGLPFVFAVWAARPGTISAAHAARLRDVRDDGVRRIGEIAAAHAGHDEVRRVAAERYLRECIRYDLDDEALRGLHAYLELARECRLVPESARAPRPASDSAREVTGGAPQRA